MRAPEHVDTRELAARALEKGIVIESGDVFFAGRRAPRNVMRLGFSSIPADRIEPGIERLGKV